MEERGSDGKFLLSFFLFNDRDGANLDAGTETNANLNHEVYYHFLGTNQSEDILCWTDPDHPKHTVSASVTDDGKVTSFTLCLLCSLCSYVGSTSIVLL